MQNDMRDRLIDLIRQSHCVDVWDYWNDDFKQPNPIEALADHLIANGVILPPCKVGDKVYLIPCYNGNPLGIVQEDKVQMIGITSRGVHIKARNHHDHNKMYMLGKTVFLTKEQAEQKLKEMRGDNG